MVPSKLHKISSDDLARQRMAFEIYCAMISSVGDVKGYFLPCGDETWVDKGKYAYRLADSFIKATEIDKLKSEKNNG